MAKLLSLSTAMLKNTFSLVDQGRKRKTNRWISIGFTLILVVALLPTVASFFMLTSDGIELLLPLNQEGVILGLLLNAVPLLIFFFALFLVPAIYYFSKDIETLLALPLRPYEILGSKLFVSLIYEYLTISFFFVPVIAAYMYIMQPAVGFYLFSILLFLTLPLVPLIFASVIMMVIMWLVPFAKNRDFFNMISGFLALGVGLWVNMQVGGLESITEGQLVAFLVEGNNSLLQTFKFIFPNIPFALNALLQGSVVDALIYLAITSAIVLGFLSLGQLLYFRGIIGINETASSRKILSEANLSKSTRSSKAIVSYTIKELKLLFKTPIYLLNCVSINFLLPILFLPLFTMSSGAEEMQDILAMIDFNSPTTITVAIGLGIAVGLTMGSINMISATAISREGQFFYFMKMIPMSYRDQLNAKAASGIILSLSGILFTIIFAGSYLKLPFYLILILLFFAIMATLFINYISLLVDVLHPKLVWESEQAAVKQNMNFLFTMIPSMGLSFLIGYVVINYPSSPFLFGTISLVVLVVATLTLVQSLPRIAEHRFKSIH
ncbi:MAG TPA: hypothetical protein DEA51_04865 [Erysipelotrichaceae bacterium]|nr:hypothetical protein [Erysipelotrichaceae bacterium]